MWLILIAYPTAVSATPAYRNGLIDEEILLGMDLLIVSRHILAVDHQPEDHVGVIDGLGIVMTDEYLPSPTGKQGGVETPSELKHWGGRILTAGKGDHLAAWKEEALGRIQQLLLHIGGKLHLKLADML